MSLFLSYKAALSAKGKYKIGCVITDKKGRVLSTSTNTYKTHPVQAYWANKVNQHKKIHLHAEIAALIKCKKGSPHAIYIARATTKGSGLAKPCPICEMAIKHSGIKRIVYTQ